MDLHTHSLTRASVRWVPPHSLAHTWGGNLTGGAGLGLRWPSTPAPALDSTPSPTSCLRRDPLNHCPRQPTQSSLGISFILTHWWGSEASECSLLGAGTGLGSPTSRAGQGSAAQAQGQGPWTHRAWCSEWCAAAGCAPAAGGCG